VGVTFIVKVLSGSNKEVSRDPRSEEATSIMNNWQQRKDRFIDNNRRLYSIGVIFARRDVTIS
jgi:hypothetical protein